MKKLLLLSLAAHIVYCADVHKTAPPHQNWNIFFSGYLIPYQRQFPHNTAAKDLAQKYANELETRNATANLYELESVIEKKELFPFSTVSATYTFFSIKFKQGPLKNLSTATTNNLIFLSAEQEKEFEEQLLRMKQTHIDESFELKRRHS